MHDILIQNTLTGKKDKFVPLKANEVRIYGCGPTVYGYTHVGNARAALTLDLVTRTLEYFGYSVTLVRNFTDVDDKIIAVAQREGITAEAVSEKFIAAYRDDLKQLKTREPNACPKVTESMAEIIAFIQGLMDKGFAYPLKTSDGTDVYFEVQKFKSYGKLSHRKLDELVSGSRAEVVDGKRHLADFALWKAAKKDEPSWSSPWGPGRPGWHIECSAMIYRIFGDSIDLHLGGLDLVFPHHENEIAQSEALTEKPLSRYWVHNGLLEFGHEKMSKSLGNIVATKDFLAVRHPEVLRMLFLQQHYRSPLDFSEENVERAEAMLERLYQAFAEAGDQPAGAKSLLEEMEKALADDFNSGKALGLLFRMIRNAFRDRQESAWQELRSVRPLLIHVFGLLQDSPSVFLKANRERKLKRLGMSAERAQSIDARLKERDELRAQKDFKNSDRIRHELEAEGVVVMDGPDGTAWTLKENEK